MWPKAETGTAIQAENGLYQLKTEFSDLDCAQLEDYVRITPPPPYGICIDRKEFRAQLMAIIDGSKPDMVILDPWNAAARDDRQKDYLETFDLIRGAIPINEEGCALGIVAHTHKPKVGERANG